MGSVSDQADLRYPLGRFLFDGKADQELRRRWIDDIELAPGTLRAAVAGLTPEQLDTPYRQGGWTVRQVVHHLADSHINSIVRFKLALTEQTPTIRPYEEARWARLPDARLPIGVSLALLDALHERWVVLLRSLTPDDFASRAYDHPEGGLTPLRAALGLYAWHGKHHTAHIAGLRQRNGW